MDRSRDLRHVRMTNADTTTRVVPRDQAGLDCPEVEACGAGLLRGQDVRSEAAPGTADQTSATNKRAQAGIVVTLPQWLGSTEEATVPHTVDLYRDSELPCVSAACNLTLS